MTLTTFDAGRQQVFGRLSLGQRAAVNGGDLTRGIDEESRRQHAVTTVPGSHFAAFIQLRIKPPTRERSIAGTVFADGKPRFIMIKGITIDAEIGQHMLYTTNKDVPGIIGALGATMGAHGVNIANFTLGRTASGGDAIALLYVDAPVPDVVLEELRKTERF